MLEQPTPVPHTSLQMLGSTQPTSSENWFYYCYSLTKIVIIKTCGIKYVHTIKIPTRVKHSADHAWKHHEKHREQFQVTTQYTSCLHMRQTAGSQTALHNYLQNTICNVKKLSKEGTELYIYNYLNTVLTWSVHQYQLPIIAMPNNTPGHGRSPVVGSLSKWKASSRGV